MPLTPPGIRLALVALFACGCASAHEEELPTRAQALNPGFETWRAAPPVRAELIGPEQPQVGLPLQVKLRVRSSPSLSGPMAVRWSLPPGVRRRDDGPVDSTFSMDPAGEPAERSLELMLDELPSQDLVVSLELRGHHAGYQAKLRYRFGRAAPVPVAPVANAPEVVVAGQRFGRSVELK